MKNVYGKAVLVASAFAAVAAASAQTNGPTGFSARLGAQFPRVGDTVFAAGLDYKFKDFTVAQADVDNPSYLGASVDYFGESGAYNIPIALTYNVRSRQIVFSAGIGVDIFKNRNNDTSSGLSGQLGVAYEFGTAPNSNPIFVQAKYFFANESDLSGLAIYLGYRF